MKKQLLLLLKITFVHIVGYNIMKINYKKLQETNFYVIKQDTANCVVTIVKLCSQFKKLYIALLYVALY